MSKVTEALRQAEAEWNAAQAALEDATYRRERAQDAVADAKTALARDEAPKLVGKAYRWKDNDPNSKHRSLSKIVGISLDRLDVLNVSESGLWQVSIILRNTEPAEFFEQAEEGWQEEIPPAEFDAEFERAVAALRDRTASAIEARQRQDREAGLIGEADESATAEGRDAQP